MSTVKPILEKLCVLQVCNFQFHEKTYLPCQFIIFFRELEIFQFHENKIIITYIEKFCVVTGSCPELGNWKTDQVLPLTSKEDPYQVLYPRYGGEIE